MNTTTKTRTTTKTATKKKAPKPYRYYAVFRYDFEEDEYGFLDYTWAKSEKHAVNQVRYNDIGLGSNDGYIAKEWDPTRHDAHRHTIRRYKYAYDRGIDL